MKKILILLLLITRPNYAGSLLSKYFKSKSKPKVELTNSSQIEDEVNINIQEQNTQEKNRLLVKYLLLDRNDIKVLKVLEPLKVEKLAISPEEATKKLENLYREKVTTDAFKWYKFRQEAFTLINSGADPNIDNCSWSEFSLLNRAVFNNDYFFANFLLKRGARINQQTLAKAKTLKMTELLISYGANPRETRWVRGNPLLTIIIHKKYDSKLIHFYVNEFKYQANTKYVDGNLLHKLLRGQAFDKEKVKILLSLGVNPFEKDDEGEISIEQAKRYLNSNFWWVAKIGHDFLECIEEYNQTFKETLIDHTKEILPLELQDYIYKFHAGEEAELFAPKDS